MHTYIIRFMHAERQRHESEDYSHGVI